MSDKIIAFNKYKGHTENRKEQEPIRISSRLQWMAALVCAILNADNVVKRSSPVVRRPPNI